MMKRWNVTIPCTMGVIVSVEAEYEESAKEAAKSVDFFVDVKAGEGSEDAAPAIAVFETHDRIAYGNVYCGCICDIEVEEA